jgi:hypothetical protein
LELACINRHRHAFEDGGRRKGRTGQAFLQAKQLDEVPVLESRYGDEPSRVVLHVIELGKNLAHTWRRGRSSILGHAARRREEDEEREETERE